MTTQTNQSHIDDETDRLVELCRTQGYDVVRALPDGSVAARSRLLYTTAVFLGLNTTGYARRFCFDSPEVADAQFRALKSEDDEPAGYIARRPE